MKSVANLLCIGSSLPSSPESTRALRQSSCDVVTMVAIPCVRVALCEVHHAVHHKHVMTLAKQQVSGVTVSMPGCGCLLARSGSCALEQPRIARTSVVFKVFSGLINSSWLHGSRRVIVMTITILTLFAVSSFMAGTNIEKK